MKCLLIALLCLTYILNVNAGTSVNGFFSIAKDGGKFKKMFLENLDSKDIATVFYATQGLKLLGEKIPNAAAVCQNVKILSQGTLNVEQCRYATGTVEILQCKSDTLKPEVLKTTVQTLDNENASLTELLNAILSLKALGNKGHDTETAIKSLKEILKKDDSMINLGLVFQICAEVGCQEWASTRVEDAVAQADQIGAEDSGAFLNWEGGLTNTVTILSGILKLQTTSTTSLITVDQSVKLANYLLSRRTVQTVKGASILVEIITLLASEKKISPVCITMSGNGQVSSDSDPIHVSVSDLLGRAHPSVSAESVIAQSATRLHDDVVVLSKQKLTSHPKDKTLFVLDLMKVKPDRGLYKLALSAGTSSSTLPIRVLGAIEIESVEVGIGDVDGTSAAKLNSIALPKKLEPALEADSLQKIIVKFTLREKGQTGIAKVHQAFVRVFSTSPDHEVLFVAETDVSKSYRMDLDIGSVAENFKHASGLYNIELIIGDSAISNPFRWTLASVNLKFASMPSTKVGLECTLKPEIVHMFREPDVRPPRLVSDVFTALCAAPLLLLFILWGRIGINVRNFPFSLSALGFHGGLGAILGLFVVFWLRLTMFETVRYLLVIGLVTFICGQRLLTNIAANRKRTQ